MVLLLVCFWVACSATRNSGSFSATVVLLNAAWFTGLCPWYDIVCTGADVVLVCRPVFAGWVA